MTDDWRYEFSSHALRDMDRLDAGMRRRVFVALDRLVVDKAHHGTRKLQGPTKEWRLRVGDWRIRFERDDATRTVRVLRVLPRDRAYRD